MTAVQNIVTSKHTYHVPVPPPLSKEGYTVSRNVAKLTSFPTRGECYDSDSCALYKNRPFTTIPVREKDNEFLCEGIQQQLFSLSISNHNL